MFEKIKAAEESLAANLNPMPHVLGALHAIAKRLEALGQEATGETGVKVSEVSDRLDSLTSAVNSLGGSVGAIGHTASVLGDRVAALEAKVSAPAVPPAPPQQ